jgi:hypothetical protein
LKGKYSEDVEHIKKTNFMKVSHCVLIVVTVDNEAGLPKFAL